MAPAPNKQTTRVNSMSRIGQFNELKDPNMMMNNTLAQLRELKLVGMATAVLIDALIAKLSPK